jgi:hypothetical protein
VPSPPPLAAYSFPDGRLRYRRRPPPPTSASRSARRRPPSPLDRPILVSGRPISLGIHGLGCRDWLIEIQG